MIFKRNIISKILLNGLKADLALVYDEETFKAALYVDSRAIPGPPRLIIQTLII